ncbi:MAG: cell envelope integrity protein CreD [Ferruginibacter sp.]
MSGYTSYGIALRLWIFTATLFATGLCCYLGYTSSMNPTEFLFAWAITTSLSLPAFIFLVIVIPGINKINAGFQKKISRLLIAQAFVTFCYGLCAASLDMNVLEVSHDTWYRSIFTAAVVFLMLFSAAFIASLILIRIIAIYFSGNNSDPSFNAVALSIFQIHKNNSTMENFSAVDQPGQQTQSNKLLIKGLVTGGLILLMLIPTIFINNLIVEREARQKEVVKEVSSKWATSQTVSGPFIVVPYAEDGVNSEGKPVVIKKQLILLPAHLEVTGNMFPENRPRSIYKVLLYKSHLNFKGTFKPTWPADINIVNVDLTNAKVCFSLSDFKGIEEEIYINFNGQKLLLAPGLPITENDNTGLSVPVSLSMELIKAGFAFDMQVKLKGSEKLHFLPLSANSSFAINSVWPNPSFDGNVLPNDRTVNEKGFSAKWNFNQANLPFGTVIKAGSFNRSSLAFGISMAQPADQYDKTMRSVKYAILFIGLTFALFFIVEIMQKIPFHPVQYVLVGLALVIFFTLLLSFSEYLVFDQAYLIAASATILLITFYAKGHFKSWQTAGVFAAVLSCLYGFIFILIRLEDTALIVGSIGLFMVLAIVMYVSRKINWYGSNSISLSVQ